MRLTSDLDVQTPPALVLDCAGHDGLRAHGPRALQAGIPVVTASLGALADPATEETLRTAARAGGTQVHLVSGAIGGLDALRAAAVGGLTRVTYTGRKPPEGWRGTPADSVLDLDHLAEPAVHFRGTAREAALRYPKNANVAAAVALAGVGFEMTEVELIADPGAVGNSHEITAQGAFGQMRFDITGHSLPDTPRTSALAAMSMVASVLEQHAPIRG
jgi:aspartate dehydrogenase